MKDFCRVNDCVHTMPEGHVMCFDHWERVPISRRRKLRKAGPKGSPEWEAAAALLVADMGRWEREAVLTDQAGVRRWQMNEAEDEWD